MRELHNDEIRQRGCIYCTDMVKKKVMGLNRKHCPYAECPYHELDEFKTYNEYIKSKGDLTFLKEK